jgi:DNA-binding CsgD family transcriptional regulator
MERLLREAGMGQTEGHMRARLAWIREVGQPLTLNDPSRVAELARFAADARSFGDDDLALGLLWRAAQRCWWGSASEEMRVSVLTAANELSVPADDARRIAIMGFIGSQRHGREVCEWLAAKATSNVEDPKAALTLGIIGNSTGAYNLSVVWLTAASAAYREQGRLQDLARVLFGRACAEIETGDWTGALKGSSESVRFGEETQQPMWMAAGLILQAMIAGRRGRFEEAQKHVEQADGMLPSQFTGFWRAILQDARGIISLGAGQPAEAYEHLRRIWTPGDPAFSAGSQFYCLADYVEAAVSCNRQEEVVAAIEDVDLQTGPSGMPWVRMTLAYVKALLSAPERAEGFFRAALSTDSQAWPFRRGRTLLAYGEWLRRQRRILDARAPLRTARDVFDALGASPWGERARRELRASGEVSRPRAERLLDALTPQELQISELVAQGLSNKEIGAKLYLSHRTVGYHLYRIYPKLGVTSRAGLRAALHRYTQLAE